ncbi:hypothetical protein [Chitinimonas naiadis]
MQRFEYMVCTTFHVEAENVARSFGGREKERLQAYSEVVVKELNKLGAQGWELMQAPDQSANRNWIFKRQMA